MLRRRKKKNDANIEIQIGVNKAKKALWERTLRRRGCRLMVNAEE